MTEEVLERLAHNNVNRDADHARVVKLFLPGTNFVWLFSEIERDGDTLFGLCDLGMGEPELGYASYMELMQVKTKLGTFVERDLHFRGIQPMSVYAFEARRQRRIVDVD